MTPRNRAILIVGLALLLIGVIVAAILMLRRATTPEAPSAPIEGPSDVVGAPPAPTEIFENPLIAPEPQVQGATAARQMAELFAERYGSYSNQGDYQNLRDLLPVMTTSYRRSTEAFLETAPAGSTARYEGVTSVKVSSEVRSMDADSAVIAVTLQQSKTVGSSAPTTGYRTLRMELELVGTDWRVAAADWED